MRVYTLLDLMVGTPVNSMQELIKAPRKNVVPQLLAIEQASQGTVRYLSDSRFIEVRWEYEDMQVMTQFKKSSAHKVTPSLCVSGFEGNKKLKAYVIQISNRGDNPSYQYFQTMFSFIYDQVKTHNKT